MFKIHTLSAHSVVLFSKRKLRKGLKKEGDRTEKKNILLFRVSNVVSILRSSAFFFVVVCPPKESEISLFHQETEQKKGKN